MENQEGEAQDQKDQQGVDRQEISHTLEDSGKDQQEADNHGETDLENSSQEVTKNEEEASHGEIHTPEDSGKDQQEADNHGETDLENLSQEVTKNEEEASHGEIHTLEDSGKDQQEADNHGETDLENSNQEVTKNEEEAALGEIDVPKPSLSQYVRCIHSIFRSRNCHIITKEELMHKIIWRSLNITESREVEELLEHLLKLVPEWISRKPWLDGYVFSIDRTIDVESILAKMEES